MTAALRARRPTRFRHLCRVLAPAAAIVALGAGAARAAGNAVTPTPLGAAASATPGLEAPLGPPQPLVIAALPAGSPGPAVARSEGRVAAGRPAAFVYRAEVLGIVSIGVSSPESAARLSIFLGNSTQAATGTEVADGAIRWSSELAVGETVRIVVHTAGAEIPFRIEVVGGPGGV